MKRLLAIILWLPITFLALITSLLFFAYHENQLEAEKQIKLKVNAFAPQPKITLITDLVPQVLGISFVQEEPDPLLETIIAYLKRYRSPMIDCAQNLLDEARLNEVDPLLLLAIAQCETNLGKKSPVDCYNPFGLGIYGEKKLCFNSWEESFQTMAKTIRNKYHNQGLYSAQEIMMKYNPYSAQEKDGAWAKCVNRFYGEISSF